jgi:cbb3-type cytochrome oxidase cytochrome c subunit
VPCGDVGDVGVLPVTIVEGIGLSKHGGGVYVCSGVSLRCVSAMVRPARREALRYAAMLWCLA